MTLDALKTEIAKPEYEGLSNQQIATAINAKTLTRARLVETWEVKKHAIESGYWPAIVLACNSDVLAVAGLAISARDWIDDTAGKIRTIDFGLASAQYLVGGLVQATLMTQEQADELLALATETVAWTVANGYPELGPGIIHSARIS